MANDNRRGVARRTLESLGYDNDLVIDEYAVWTGQSSIVRLDAVGFAANPTDMSTATVVCETGSALTSSIVDAARALASPLILLVDGDRVRLHATTLGHRGAQPVSEWFLPDDSSYLGELRQAVEPSSLLRFKRGEQGSLFPLDVGLLDAANSTLRDDLMSRVTNTILGISENLSETDGRQSLKRSSRLLVGGLACLMMRDKLLGGESAATLPTEALRLFPRYFSWYEKAPSLEKDLLAFSIESLGSGITYRGLSPAIVSGVYESVVVQEDDRRQLGIYYTPPQLAKRIVDALPIEEIEPEERRILDPTCGSGTLLLASYDRVQQLLVQEDWDSARRHHEVSRRIYGWDSDPFAVQMTQLALLVHDMPQGNGWNIQQRNALDAPTNLASRPTIAVANPPWLLRAGESDGRRGERANQYLTHLLEQLSPGGLLAMVLPSAWLTSTYARGTQSWLRDLADIFEVWRLPETLFHSARVGAAVVFARKKPTVAVDSWTAFRRVDAGKGNLARFYRTGRADEVVLLPHGAPLASGALTQALQGGHLLRLDSLADVAFGPQPKSALTAGYSAEGSGRSPLWMRHARSLPPFKEAPSTALQRVAYPDDFEYRMPFEKAVARKVLASATRWADNPWRLKVGIDLQGIVPRNSLFMVKSKAIDLPESEALFALMALLASGVASLWIDEHATKRSARVEDLKSLPVPSNIDWPALAVLGEELYRASDADTLRPLLHRLEETVWQNYGLDEDIQAALIGRLQQKSGPEGFPRYEGVSPALPTTDRETGAWSPGSVLDIKAGLLRLWISGVTDFDGYWVPLPANFPGALCHAGATFETGATDIGGIAYAQFRLHSMTWLDDEDLFGNYT